MAYTVDAYNPVSPLISDGPPSNVAAELRALKVRLDIMQAGIDAAPNPVGSILIFPVNTAPAKYMVVPTVPTDVSRGTYPALFAALGTLWGIGDGSTTFGIPYIPEGNALLAGSVGTHTDGTLVAHTHPFVDAYFMESSDKGPALGSKISVPASTYVGSASSDKDNDVLYCRDAVTASTGTGTKNLAAGTFLKFYLRYE